jgi:predicted MFS family arabinose efflux permease
MASGVNNVAWQVAGALGAGAGGALIYAAGYPPAFLSAAALYSTGIALVALWFGRWRKPSPVGASVMPDAGNIGDE